MSREASCKCSLHFFLPFLQTISIALWVSSYCDSVLRPFKSNLQKKKKKKKESSVAMVQTIFLSLFP